MNKKQIAFLIGIGFVMVWLAITVYSAFADNKNCYAILDTLIEQKIINNSDCQDCLLMKFQNHSYFFAWQHNLTDYKSNEKLMIKLCYFPSENKTYVRGISNPDITS